MLSFQQREALIDNHNQRKEKLEELLQETKDKVADHEEGRKLLEDDEYTTMKKRVGLYGQKLERMKEPLDSRVSFSFPLELPFLPLWSVHSNVFLSPIYSGY